MNMDTSQLDFHGIPQYYTAVWILTYEGYPAPLKVRCGQARSFFSDVHSI